MIVCAITGGIACGKSTVARFFEECGATVRDADVDAREVRADPAVRDRIQTALGTVEPTILASRIYSDPEARKKLNAIVHPEVRKRMRAAIDAAKNSSEPGLLLYEVPLLFEGGLETWFECVICAFSPPDVQRARLRLRHSELSERQIDSRLAAQLPIEEKARRAQYVIRTDGTLEVTRDQVAVIWRQLAA